MKRILIISDGKPGHLNQSIAFCKIKNISYDILEIKFKSKFHKLLSYAYDKIGYYTNGLFQNYKKHYYEFYDAVVSCGSSTYYFNKLISKEENKKSIVLMLPKGYKYQDFDYIIAQKHDNPPMLENLIQVPLNISFSKPKGLIKHNKEKDSIGIIIGGNNAVFSFDVLSLKNRLDEIFKDNKDKLKFVTTSRRTSKEVEELIETYDFDYKLIYSNDPNINPIPDFLEQCKKLYITIDSTSMLSEARANSEAKITIIDLVAKKQNTKFHKLASIVESINKKVDFEKLLKRVEV